MSVLIDASHINSKTPLWTSISTPFTGTNAANVNWNTIGEINISPATPVQLSQVTFPSSLTTTAVLNGWLRMTVSVTGVSGDFYISSYSGASYTQSRRYFVNLSQGVNYVNLTGLDCVPSGSVIYVWFLPTSSNSGVTVSLASVQFNSVAYSSMPTNSWTTASVSAGLVSISGI